MLTPFGAGRKVVPFHRRRRFDSIPVMSQDRVTGTDGETDHVLQYHIRRVTRFFPLVTVTGAICND